MSKRFFSQKTIFLSTVFFLLAFFLWDGIEPRIVMDQEAYPVGTVRVTGVWRSAPWRAFDAGKNFSLERQANGYWQPVRGDEMLEISIGITYRCGAQLDFSLAHYGALTPGCYRVCVQARGRGRAEERVYGVFEIL